MRSIADKTSAADKSIGFDYQFYFFIEKLLDLKPGQSVGLEVRDDVHTTLNSDFQILVQLKHTTQKKADGTTVNLTELDGDLWKTLNNWSQIICDAAEGRAGVTDQLVFVNRTEFHLVTNKSESLGNEMLQLIASYQEDPSTFLAVTTKLEALRVKTKEVELKGYILQVQSLAVEVQTLFFQRLRFDLGHDDIVRRIKQGIRAKFIDEQRIDSVFHHLFSALKNNAFATISNGGKVEISFEQFMLEYRRVFQEARTARLPAYPFSPDLPNDLLSQTFIKQLLSISDISTGDTERILECTTFKLHLVRHLQEWQTRGELMASEVEGFHNEAIVRWRNAFLAAYRSAADDGERKLRAFSLIDSLRREQLELASEKLNTSMSNGEFYHLSDVPLIGWHHDWENVCK